MTPVNRPAAGSQAPAERTVTMLHESVRPPVYRLFASLFLYPAPERISALGNAAVKLRGSPLFRGHPFSSALERLLDCILALKLEHDQPIVNEYNRLFLIRPEAPPYETCYTDTEGQFRGLLSAGLEKQYHQAGLAISPELNELPDHIAVELEFMAYLCLQEALARAAGDSARAFRYRELQESFLRRHLAQWFPKFAHKLKASEPGSLYRFLLPAVYQFLMHEVHALRSQT